MTNDFQLSNIQESDFQNLESDWNRLLNQSNANPLFMSWQWQYTWWQCWSNKLALELRLISVLDNNSQLVGIFPLYKRTEKKNNRFHFIGNTWRFSSTVRSEYISPILSKHLSHSEASQICNLVAKLLKIQTLTIRDCTKDISELVNPNRYLAIKRESDYGVRLECRSDFNHYLSTLGRNTRLKLFGRRTLLFQRNSIKIITIDQTPSEFDHFFLTLNTMHVSRWGRPCFDDTSLQFHKSLISRLSELDGFAVYLDMILDDDKPISCSYNISIDGTTYNIQSSFLEDYDKKISLGTLHFGFILQRAFEDPKISYFDFLVGNGKNSFYKSRYKGSTYELHTVQFRKLSLSTAALAVYYHLPTNIRLKINDFSRIFK